MCVLVGSDQTVHLNALTTNFTRDVRQDAKGRQHLNFTRDCMRCWLWLLYRCGGLPFTTCADQHGTCGADG